MKKLFIIALVFITTSCTLFNQEEEFVNPLFYKKMETITFPDGILVKITPTQYYAKDSYGKVPDRTELCKLIENTADTVTLICTRKCLPQDISWRLEHNIPLTEPVAYTFKITDMKDENYPNEIYIKRYFYGVDENLTSASIDIYAVDLSKE